MLAACSETATTKDEIIEQVITVSTSIVGMIIGPSDSIAIGIKKKTVVQSIKICRGHSLNTIEDHGEEGPDDGNH